MIHINQVDTRALKAYSTHLKNLDPEDNHSRFGFVANNDAIDKLMLNVAYNHHDHKLWEACDYEETLGWGHMAKMSDGKWELAVSVEKEHQRKGVGDRLIEAMLSWAKFHLIDEVFMHCIESNKVIQHLAAKHDLKTIERGYGERTAAVEIPEPTFVESNNQMIKEQLAVLHDIAELRTKMFNLWMNPNKTLD